MDEKVVILGLMLLDDGTIVQDCIILFVHPSGLGCGGPVSESRQEIRDPVRSWGKIKETSNANPSSRVYWICESMRWHSFIHSTLIIALS